MHARAPLISAYARLFRQRFNRWAETVIGERMLRYGRFTLTAAVILFLAYQLAGIGWREVATSIPTTPWFYLIWALAYIRLPIIEMLIYRRIWPTGRLELLYAFLRKRALNADVMGYSGEVYLFAWAKKAVPLRSNRIWKGIKDNLITSSLASVGTAILVLSGLAFSGLLDAWLQASWIWYAVGIIVIVALAVALLVQFRRSVFSFPARIIAWMGGWHTFRFLIGYVLSIAMWTVVLPDVPFESWAILLALFVVTDRIPIIPSRDLLFVGVSVEASAIIGVPEAALAGLLLTQTVLGKVVNFAFFVSLPLYWSFCGKEGLTPAEQDAARSVMEGELDDESSTSSRREQTPHE